MHVLKTSAKLTKTYKELYRKQASHSEFSISKENLF